MVDTCFFNSSHQRTPLHWAADRGDVDTVRYLFDKGAEINIKDSVGVSEWEYTADFKLALLISVCSPVTQPNEKEDHQLSTWAWKITLPMVQLGENDLVWQTLLLIAMHYVGYTESQWSVRIAPSSLHLHHSGPATRDSQLLNCCDVSSAWLYANSSFCHTSSV